MKRSCGVNRGDYASARWAKRAGRVCVALCNDISGGKATNEGGRRGSSLGLIVGELKGRAQRLDDLHGEGKKRVSNGDRSNGRQTAAGAPSCASSRAVRRVRRVP